MFRSQPPIPFFYIFQIKNTSEFFFKPVTMMSQFQISVSIASQPNILAGGSIYLDELLKQQMQMIRSQSSAQNQIYWYLTF